MFGTVWDGQTKAHTSVKNMGFVQERIGWRIKPLQALKGKNKDCIRGNRSCWLKQLERVGGDLFSPMYTFSHEMRIIVNTVTTVLNTISN